MRVLGIEVDGPLLETWRWWFSPPRQPFRVDGLDAATRSALIPHSSDQPVSDEHRDTFFMYGGEWVWIDEANFRRLPTSAQRALMAGRRRGSRPKPPPCWPSTPAEELDTRLVRWVEAGVRPSRHESVAASTWELAATTLPGARRLAGTFAPHSGPNCFGAVMAAAGEVGAEAAWMLQGPFAAWLDARTTPVKGTQHDLRPGVVLVWHEHGQLAHAAVTLGDGWALSKPSQSWSSPTLVWTVSETIASWRLPGTRLSRHRLTA